MAAEVTVQFLRSSPRTDPKAAQPIMFGAPSALSLATSQDPRLPSLCVVGFPDVEGKAALNEGLPKHPEPSTKSQGRDPHQGFLLVFLVPEKRFITVSSSVVKRTPCWCFVLRRGE